MPSFFYAPLRQIWPKLEDTGNATLYVPHSWKLARQGIPDNEVALTQRSAWELAATALSSPTLETSASMGSHTGAA